jgi:membrane protease YdiL (CAAX protease family)
MKSVINWRIFFILLGSSLLSVCAVFPYVVSVQGDVLRQVALPIATIVLLQLIQSAALFSLTIFLGLLLAKKIGFHLPILEAVVAGKDYKVFLKRIAVPSMVSGMLIAVSIYLVDYVFTAFGARLSTSQDLAPIWQKLLAAFYGGITEELLMRLFLMSFFVWMGTRLTRHAKPSQPIIMLSIFLASVIFGLGHLPITASVTTITPLIILRAIVLNGIGGVVFGWLYWKKGLEAAMISHFTTDIFLLTILPLVF